MSPVQFLEILLSVSLQATIYVGLCACLSRWVSSDQIRSRLWTYCQFGLLGLVIIGCSLPHFRIVHNRELANPQAILDAFQQQVRIGQICLTIWTIGALISLLRVLISGVSMVRFLKNLRPLAPDRLPLDGLDQDEKALLKVQYFISNSLVSPFCWQFQQPVMVLPESTLQFPPDELRLILKHELAHLRADHPLHLFIQQLVQCIYWFHPAVYWAGKQTDVAREMMCDAAATESRQDIASYLRVLLKFSEIQPVAPAPGPLGLGLIFQQKMSAVAQRARRLTERARKNSPCLPQRRWMPACAFLLVGLVTSLWLPVNALSSPRSNWSACPRWTADILHDFGFSARDYEVYDGRLQIFDRDFEQAPAHD